MLSPRLSLAVSTALLAGCGNSLAPFQPEISNLPGNFQAQATNVKNVTGTWTYTWVNSKTTANVNQATSVTAGSATILIKDAAVPATTVYSADLSGNGTFVTSAGTAGSWTIQFTLSNYSGTLNFRVQTP